MQAISRLYVLEQMDLSIPRLVCESFIGENRYPAVFGIGRALARAKRVPDGESGHVNRL